jgi:hypothetical protein
MNVVGHQVHLYSFEKSIAVALPLASYDSLHYLLTLFALGSENCLAYRSYLSRAYKEAGCP